MDPNEAAIFKENFLMYKKIWENCKTNTKKRPICNLNKELRKTVENFTSNQKELVVERRLVYEVKLFSETDYPLSEDFFERKWQQRMKMPLSCEFYREHDMKWRHVTSKWSFFNQYWPTIEEILEKNQVLKEHIYGGNTNFKFDPLWIESRTEMMIYHARTITRCERDENVEFQSLWSSKLQIYKYALGNGQRIPLKDPFRL